MLSRPAWLALGVVAAAVAGTCLPPDEGGPAAAAGVAGCLALAAAAGIVGRGQGRERAAERGRERAAQDGRAAGHGQGATPSERISVAASAAALGAGLVAVRLAVGVAFGSPSHATAPPSGTTQTWRATVEAAHQSKGRQIATLVVGGGDASAAATNPGPGPASGADAASAEPGARAAASTTARDAASGGRSDPIVCSATLPADPRLVAGDRIEWHGRIEPLGDTAYDQYLAAQGMAANCQADGVAVLSHDHSPAGLLESFRQASGDAIQRVVPEPAGGLLAAILIGLRDRVDRDVAADFTTAGVSHIVAISGWNIAIVSATLAALLRRRLARRPRAVMTAVAIIAYTLFAGASASVVRAAVMALVAIATLESGRGTRVSVGLAWAATVMILADPATISDVGFLLSAAATAGLIAWATPLTDWLNRRAPRLPAAVRESLGVSMAAQIATLPLVLAVFGRLALIAPVANLVAVPLVPPAMGLGLVALIAGWVSGLGLVAPICGLAALPASLLLSMLVGIVGCFAGLPGANQTLGPPWNLAAAVVAAVALLPFSRWIAGLARERTTRPTEPAPRPKPGRAGPPVAKLAGIACLSVLVATSLYANAPDGRIHVIVLDVGQGDAILLEGNRGGRILVDGGPDGNVLLSALDAQIPSWDRRLDAIVLTHPHDDHVTGLVTVVSRYRIGRAFESGWPSETPEYRAWRDALTTRTIRLDRLATGGSIQLDDATLRVLWPDDGPVRPAGLDPAATDNRKTNDSSIVLLGEFEGRRFLLTGDVEDDVDPTLVARGLPRVDMLKVAHHGSATASSASLLAALHPAVSVVSVGADNTYGHPNAGTLGRLGAVSKRTYRTDRAGTVDVTLDRASVAVSTSRGAAAALDEPLSSQSLLLYDFRDDRSQSSREHGAPPLARSTPLASAPLARRRGGRRVARVMRPTSGLAGRSPPRGGRVPAPRRRQAARRPSRGRRHPARRGIGRVAGCPRLSGARTRYRRPSRDAPGRHRLVRDVARGGNP